VRVVTVARKPCKGGVTANVTQNQAGALNLEGAKIGLRWAANAVFEHLPGCRVVDTVRVEGYAINRWADGAKPFGGGAGHDFETEILPDEEVDIWECEEDCPLKSVDPLDARYFKQVRREERPRISDELLEYLYVLIAPPSSCDPVVLVEESLDEVPWELYEDTSVHGILTVGNPTPHLQEMDRVLRPGAHVLLVASEEEPTGWPNACAIEDFGYEIRDAIAVFDEPGSFHYVSKPSGKEKHAGVAEHEDPETGRTVRNNHETIKPVAVMRALLRDIPPDQGLVVDPFLGSGTTAIACLYTGHGFLGIENHESYLAIADQRVRYWERAIAPWNAAEIQSEVSPPEEEDEGPLEIGDLFGIN